jgi:hypothetical protein
VLYVGHGLPAYNPGMPALGLTYSSIAAERRPIFINRYEIPTSGGIPNTVSARLQFDGSWGSTKYYQTGSGALYNPGDILQISLQADAGSSATGRYSYSFETTANYSGSSSTTTSSGTVTIINEESSVFGEGWSLGAGGWGLGVGRRESVQSPACRHGRRDFESGGGEQPVVCRQWRQLHHAGRRFLHARVTVRRNAFLPGMLTWESRSILTRSPGGQHAESIRFGFGAPLARTTAEVSAKWTVRARILSL